MGARASGSAGIDDPGRGVEIHGQQMTVTINDGAGARKTSPQQTMTMTCRDLMAVNHDQAPAGQWLFQAFGEMNEQRAILCRPFARHIVVAEDSQHPAESRLDLGEDGGVTDVPAMHGQIAALDDFPDARIECTVGVGQNGDTHQRHGRNSIQNGRVMSH